MCTIQFATAIEEEFFFYRIPQSTIQIYPESIKTYKILHTILECEPITLLGTPTILTVVV
jgi:hypothetical protein